jgi:hypothetical protein
MRPRASCNQAAQNLCSTLCCLLQAGDYTFSALPPAGYAALLGHSLQVQVVPSAAYAASCSLSVAAPPVPVAGSRLNITVSLRDAYGNGIADAAGDPASQVWLEVKGKLAAVVGQVATCNKCPGVCR